MIGDPILFMRMNLKVMSSDLPFHTEILGVRHKSTARQGPTVWGLGEGLGSKGFIRFRI